MKKSCWVIGATFLIILQAREARADFGVDIELYEPFQDVDGNPFTENADNLNVALPTVYLTRERETISVKGRVVYAETAPISDKLRLIDDTNSRVIERLLDANGYFQFFIRISPVQHLS